MIRPSEARLDEGNIHYWLIIETCLNSLSPDCDCPVDGSHKMADTGEPIGSIHNRNTEGWNGLVRSFDGEQIFVGRFRL